MYWALQLNHQAIMLALAPPYDTVQVTATPLNALGEPLAGPASVTYQALDSAVTVTPTGLVSARYVTQGGFPARVVASAHDPVQGITNVDTAFIMVTTAPQSFRSFSMQPAPGDSAKRALGGDFGFTPSTFSWPATAVTTAGDTVCRVDQCAILVHYHTSNTLVATINVHTGEATTHDTGDVAFSANSLVYGVPWRDSVLFHIGPQIFALVILGDGTYGNPPGVFTIYQHRELVLGTGAIMDFIKAGGYQPLQITFTPSAPVDSASDPFFGLPQTGSGNITFACDSVTNPSCFSPNEFIKARRFRAPGTYQVHYSLRPEDTYDIIVQ